VALDKSEGAVKQKVSLAMPEHRDVYGFTTNKATVKASVLNQLGGKLAVPATIDSIPRGRDHDSSIRTPNLFVGWHGPRSRVVFA
jgi:hypothetical protein